MSGQELPDDDGDGSRMPKEKERMPENEVFTEEPDATRQVTWRHSTEEVVVVGNQPAAKSSISDAATESIESISLLDQKEEMEVRQECRMEAHNFRTPAGDALVSSTKPMLSVAGGATGKARDPGGNKKKKKKQKKDKKPKATKAPEENDDGSTRRKAKETGAEEKAVKDVAPNGVPYVKGKEDRRKVQCKFCAREFLSAEIFLDHKYSHDHKVARAAFERGMEEMQRLMGEICAGYHVTCVLDTPHDVRPYNRGSVAGDADEFGDLDVDVDPIAELFACDVDV